jgi:hypothetical protein
MRYDYRTEQITLASSSDYRNPCKLCSLTRLYLDKNYSPISIWSLSRSNLQAVLVTSHVPFTCKFFSNMTMMILAALWCALALCLFVTYWHPVFKKDFTIAIRWNLYPSFVNALFSRKYRSLSMVLVHHPYNFLAAITSPHTSFTFCSPFTNDGYRFHCTFFCWGSILYIQEGPRIIKCRWGCSTVHQRNYSPLKA